MARKDPKTARKGNRRSNRGRVTPQTLVRLQTQCGAARLHGQRARTVTIEGSAPPQGDGAGKRLAYAASESLRYSALSILALAERRITDIELVQLEHLVEQEPEKRTVAESLDFLGKFWGVIVRATLNPDLERDVGSRLRQATKLQRRYGMGLESNNRILSKAPYRGLIQVLRRGYGAPAFWARRLEAMAVED